MSGLNQAYPDLAAAFARRHATGEALIAFGYVGVCVGVVVAPWMLYRGNGWGGFAGLGLAVAGVSAKAFGEGLLDPSLPEDQAIDMAARYNTELRRHLGAHGALDGVRSASSGRWLVAATPAARAAATRRRRWPRDRCRLLRASVGRSDGGGDRELRADEIDSRPCGVGLG